MRRLLILIAFYLGMGPNLQAQATDPAYDKKLSKLYRGSVPVIQPAELKALQEEGQEIILLDTRAPGEYAVSHIDGAQFVNYDKFKKKDVNELNREAKVVVYCTVGYRSERIGEQLRKMGFKDVHNLYGGIFEWVNQGNAVVNESGEATERVHAFSKDWGVWLQEGEKVYK